jgi:hypothetical protein
MILSVSIGILAVAGIAATGEPSSLLAERIDTASAFEVVRRLEAMDAAHPGELEIIESLLRARKFVADGLPDDDEHAGELHTQNVQDGLAALSTLSNRDFDDFGELLDGWSDVPRSAVGVLYWTTLSYGRTIPERFFLARPAAVGRFRTALERLVELDAAYFHAGPLRVLASLEARAPGFMGGDRDAAVRHGLAAVRRAPDFAPNRVALARAALERGGDRGRVIGLLQGALERSGRLPGADQPEQRRGLEAVRRLLERLR